MINKHLSDDQVARSAESIIINGSVNFSNSIRKHLDYCMTCSLEVQVKVDDLKTVYKDQICSNLSRSRNANSTINLWFGVSLSIIFVITLGIMFLKQ